MEAEERVHVINRHLRARLGAGVVRLLVEYQVATQRSAENGEPLARQRPGKPIDLTLVPVATHRQRRHRADFSALDMKPLGRLIVQATSESRTAVSESIICREIALLRSPSADDEPESR